MVSAEIESRIDRLQAGYITALDGKNMQAWYETFADHAQSSYTCISAENVDAGLPVAFILDDNRARLADRVFFVNKVWAGTFQDYLTRHFMQRLSCTEVEQGRYAVKTNFTVMYTPEELGDSRVLACGRYEDEIVAEGAELKFVSKRAVLDTIVLPRYIVYPV